MLHQLENMPVHITDEMHTTLLLRMMHGVLQRKMGEKHSLVPQHTLGQRSPFFSAD